MAFIGILLFVAGPLVTLGIWLWLRSRRAPIALLDPLDIGRVIGLGFRVFTPEGWPVLVLSAILIGLPQIVSVLVTRPMMLARAQQLAAAGPNPFAVFQAMMTIPFIIGAVIGFLLLMTFLVASTIYLVSRFEGVPVSIGDALARAPARVLPAVGAIILSGIGISLGWVLFLLPGIILALNWMMIVPVISCENAGFFGSFSRSRSLALGSRGRILVLLILLMVIAILLSIPNMLASGAIVGHSGTPTLLFSAWQIVFAILITAFETSFFAGLYVELRRIRDGMSAPGLSEVFA